MKDTDEPIFIKYLRYIESEEILPFNIDDMLRNTNIRDHLLKSSHYARWRLGYACGEFKASLIRNTFLKKWFK